MLLLMFKYKKKKPLMKISCYVYTVGFELVVLKDEFVP